MIDLQINGQTISLNVSPEVLRGLTEQQIEWCAKKAEDYDFSSWVLKSGLTLDGQPFSFDRHEYLIEPYQALSDPQILALVFEKAAQMGLTVAEVLAAFHGMIFGRYPKGVLYLFPTEHHMQKVSKTKIQPIIDENLVLQSLITKTDSIGEKRVGNSNLIIHGMNSRLGLKSYSVDAVIFDEVEEIEDWSHLKLAEERMSHSEVKWLGETIRGGVTHCLSVPSVPEWGIDLLFVGKQADDGTGWEVQPSDQRYWLIRCQHCNTDNCLEDEWPDCVVEVSAKDQTAIRVCRKCRQELDISHGRWVAKKPGQFVRGYHFSQLFSHFVNPWKLLDQFRKKSELETLFNDKLGIAYVRADARIEFRDMISLCGSTKQLAAFEGPAAMGVDQPDEEGGKFHVVIAYKQEKQPCNVIRVCIRNTWAELGQLMNIYNVARCVVDGLPDQAKARAFADSFRGKVFLNFYVEKQKGCAKWNEEDWTVNVDRTETLDESTRLVHEKEMSLPEKDDEIIQFARHCHNMARKHETNEDTGIVRHVWQKTGPDHFRHALNYCNIALSEIGEYIPPKKEKDWMKQRRQSASSWRTV